MEDKPATPGECPSGGASARFIQADFSPARTLARIAELRTHLREELLPATEARGDGTFVMPFVQYLDTWALYFGNQVDAPLELLAFAVRNLLEFSLLLPIVFETAESRALFLNEALRLDVGDIQTRIEKCFASLGATLPGKSVEDIEWLSESNVRLVGKRDVFDTWLHKFCSKLMHPTAIMIMVPDALTGPEKRTTLCLGGFQYLALSYNFLNELPVEP